MLVQLTTQKSDNCINALKDFILSLEYAELKLSKWLLAFVTSISFHLSVKAAVPFIKFTWGRKKKEEERNQKKNHTLFTPQ